MKGPVLSEGRNCARLERVSRLAVLVDGDQYFRAFFDVAKRAERSIDVLGWEVDSYLGLRRIDRRLPNESREFFHNLARAKPRLRINIMTWRAPAYLFFKRERFARLKWNLGPRNLKYRQVGHSHIYGSHHEKIAMVDGVCAFLGGQDITTNRWDTPEHSPSAPRRSPDGTPYNPNHDVQTVVSGPVVEAVRAHLRQRHLGQAPATARDLWPDIDVPVLEDVRAGLSLTWAGKACHIETLYLDAIRAAERYLYIENQYFSSCEVIAELERSLARPEGPEVLVVLPRTYRGKFENAVYGGARQRAMARLKRADRHGRLAMLYPDNTFPEPKTFIVVHSKVMVADGTFLTVGSANLNNRSLKIDSESNLTVEGVPGDATAAFVEDTLCRLLSEHLGMRKEDFHSEWKARGSLLSMVRACQGRHARTLRDIPAERPESWASVLRLLRPFVDLRFSLQRSLGYVFILCLSAMGFMFWATP